jgi:iron complex outermembrane receptor protein
VSHPAFPFSLAPLAIRLTLVFPIAALAQPGSLVSENPVLPTIDVQDQHDDASRSTHGFGFGHQPDSRTPIAIDTLDSTDLSDRGVQSLSTAIRTSAGVSDNYNTFGYIEGLEVRGFALHELLNYQRDGMTVSNHVPVALEDKERVEILKGTSGMEAGVSAPGGLVNYVLKQPTDTPLHRVAATISEHGSTLVHGDFGGRFGTEQAFGYRVNLVAEDRRPLIQDAWSHRTLLSGFFDWRVRPGTLVQVEFERQAVSEISVPGYSLLDSAGIGTGTTVPALVPPSVNLNNQPWSQPFQSTATTGSVRLSQRLSDHWDLLVRGGTQRSVTNDRIAFPDGCSSASTYVYNGMCANGDIDLYQYISDGERRVASQLEARLHGQVHHTLTGDHDLTLGASSLRYTERYPSEQTYTWVGTVNVYAPSVLPGSPMPNTPNAPLDMDTQQLYAFDSARHGDHWGSWLGVRLVRMTQDSELTDGSNATHLDQHQASPWLGLSYQATESVFSYVSYGQGLELATAPNHVTQRSTGNSLVLANAGQALPVQRSHQAELGLKVHGIPGWSLDAALYRIEKPFADNVPVPGGNTYVQVSGARVERHQGLEMLLDLHADPHLTWRMSLSWMDARTISAVDPGWVGKPAQNVAPLSAVLQQAWQPRGMGGWSWTNLLGFNGHKTALPDGSVYLPNSWQWDTATQYRWQSGQTHYTVRAGVDNVTQRQYWREAPMASWGSIYLFPAAARTGRVGIQVQW